MNKTWGYWLNEPIFTDKGTTNICKRKHALHTFCVDGVIPFIESKGYFLYKSDREIYKTLLHVLFTYYQGKRVLPHPIEYPHSEDHYITYIHIFDTDAWTSFWSRWSNLQDFEPDAYGEPFKYILPDLLWSWIDLDNSVPIQILEKELNEYDEQDDATINKGKEDTYLQEHSKRDYQDRHW